MECSTSAAISCQHHGLPPSGNIHQEEIRKKTQCNGNVEGKCMEFSGDGLQTCNQRKAWKKLCFFAKLLMLLMLSHLNYVANLKPRLSLHHTLSMSCWWFWQLLVWGDFTA